MFLLEFDRGSMREPSEKQVAVLGTTSEMNLRYAYFEANVSFSAEGFDIETLQVPLLDFVHCGLLAAHSVREGKSGRISFTESSMLIDFIPEGLELKALRSWDSTPGSCGIGEYLESVSRFSAEVLDYVTDRHPVFRQNPYYGVLKGMIHEIQHTPPR